MTAEVKEAIRKSHRGSFTDDEIGLSRGSSIREAPKVHSADLLQQEAEYQRARSRTTSGPEEPSSSSTSSSIPAPP